MITNSTLSTLQSELDYYRHLIFRYEKELAQLPEGYLSCQTVRGVQRYYHKIEKDKKKYVSSKNIELLAALARKRLIVKSLPELRRKEKKLSAFVKGYAPYDPLKICDELPGFYKRFQQEYRFRTQDFSAQAWFDAPFEKNPNYQDYLIHRTIAGDLVRSKSEVLIVELLNHYNIPYRYEALLELGTVRIYPDFTIRRPRDGRIVYWEHAGMMDDDHYAASLLRKLALYSNHDILLWNNLILTQERKTDGINTSDLHHIIKACLL